MQIHVGKGVGLVIERALMCARERILVVTPWISEEYASLLKKKSQEGVSVSLIISRPEESKGALSTVLVRRLSPLYLALLAVALIIFFFSLVFHFYIPSLLAGILFILSAYSLLKRSPAFELVEPETFVHAKIYVVDDRAFLSSANLTRAGMHENIEFVVEVDDPAEVQKIVDILNALK